MSSTTSNSSNPIGVFDSGHGGLTVLSEIVSVLPNEDTIYFGDTANFPYGPRDLAEVRGFAERICQYLCDLGCKLIVVACNTATAAALPYLQERFDAPIIGVVEPGARAAVQATSNRRIGIMATNGTVDSGVYDKAVKHQDAGAKVYSVACSKLVEIAEAGLYTRASEGDYQIYLETVSDYMRPLVHEGVDTIVMGCTHFPLIQDMLAMAAGPGITLVSSAEETSREVATILTRKGDLAPDDRTVTRRFFTSGSDIDLFARFARKVVGDEIDEEEADACEGAHYLFEKVSI